MIEGVWNTCSYVIDEWGIKEIEESLETLTLKAEDVEKVRASSEVDIITYRFWTPKLWSSQ